MTEPTREQIEEILAQDDVTAVPSFGNDVDHDEWSRAVLRLALDALDGRNDRRLGKAVRAVLPVNAVPGSERQCDLVSDIGDVLRVSSPGPSRLYHAIATALRSETP